MKNTTDRPVRIGKNTYQPGDTIPAKLAEKPSVKLMFGGNDEPEPKPEPKQEQKPAETKPAPPAPKSLAAGA